jgi:hypothetical protein
MTDTSQSFKPGDVANGHVLTDSGQWLPVGGPGPTGPGTKAKKPIWTRWWMIMLYVFVVLMVIFTMTSGGSDPKTDDPAASSSPKAEEPAAEEPVAEEPVAEEPVVKEPVATPEPTPVAKAEPTQVAKPEPTPVAKPEPKPEPELTASQENAIGSAEDYLEYSAFSRTGLIEQLSSEYGEGFPKADAIFAVNHIEVDWNEQAAKSAKEYLDYDSFSRQGLIDQLSSEYGEGFSLAQAIYGVSKTGL